MSVLQQGEPSPVTIVNPNGTSRFILICEHAGNRIPATLNDLGLKPHELESHIAWDIGAANVARNMADQLNATLFLQTYSRLVCDCNRRLSVQDFAPHISETIVIPENVNLTETEKRRRADEIYFPFHDAIAREIERRIAREDALILLTIHSFTPVFKGVDRPWHIGVLFNNDRRFSVKILEILRRDTHYEVGENQPYFMSDETDCTVPMHGEERGLPCVEIEIRNDLIRTAAHQDEWARLLCRTITEAADDLPCPSRKLNLRGIRPC